MNNNEQSRLEEKNMFSDELEIVAQRFSLSKSQAIKAIIHEVYLRGCDLDQFKNIFKFFETYEEPQDYNCDGEEDEPDEFPELTEILYQLDHLKLHVENYLDKLKYPNQEPPF